MTRPTQPSRPRRRAGAHRQPRRRAQFFDILQIRESIRSAAISIHPGAEVAGTVDAVGAGVRQRRRGRPCAGHCRKQRLSRSIPSPGGPRLPHADGHGFSPKRRRSRSSTKRLLRTHHGAPRCSPASGCCACRASGVGISAMRFPICGVGRQIPTPAPSGMHQPCRRLCSPRGECEVRRGGSTIGRNAAASGKSMRPHAEDAGPPGTEYSARALPSRWASTRSPRRRCRLQRRRRPPCRLLAPG